MSITWNGVSSDTIGVIVERIPNRYVPTRRFSPQQVAGRNGNILLVDKAFPNVEQEYEVYLSAEAQGLPSVARACAEWLMGPDGYCRLEDSYDTTVYREAFLMGGYDLENILNKFGRCTITFSCKPQKYLLTGDIPIEIPAGITTYTGDVVQFDGATGANITSLSTTIIPTQAGSGDPSPTNIRPITGLTGLSVYRTGKNLFPYKDVESQTKNGVTFTVEKSNGVITNIHMQGTATAQFSFLFYVNGVDEPWVLPKGDFKFYIGGDKPTQSLTFDLNVRKIGSTSDIVVGSNVATITLSEQTAFGSAYIWIYSGAVLNHNITPVIVQSGVDTSVKYPITQRQSITIDLDQTVYGGTLDVVTGVLKTRPYIASYNGETLVGPWVSSMDAYAPAATPTTGAQVVDMGGAETTYQLTPQEIEVLVGENNVWTSSGPVSVTVEAPFVGTVTNPTPFDARPMLEVSGVGEITINGKSIHILESVSDFDIDCESMEAEDNSKIYCMDFPELSGGENEIVGDGSITALTVTPRWWTL